MRVGGHLRRMALACALCALGCTSTETGNPPAQPDTGLEAGNITFLLVPNMGDPGLLSGFVQMNVPFGAELHVTAVDTTFDTVRVPIVGEPPGFTTTLPAAFSGWLRLQIVASDGPEFGPLDVLTSDASVGGMVELLPSPVGDCLEVPTSLTLDADGAADVELVNRCDGPLTFEALLARLGGVSATPATGFTLARNGRRTIAIARTGTFPTGDAEVLVLREASGERRAVTIRE
jgi:hypothetical protein